MYKCGHIFFEISIKERYTHFGSIYAWNGGRRRRRRRRQKKHLLIDEQWTIFDFKNYNKKTKFFKIVSDYVYFETSSTSPFQIRRIEELNKTASGNVEAKVMCFYRRRDLPNPLVQLADKHQSKYMFWFLFFFICLHFSFSILLLLL